MNSFDEITKRESYEKDGVYIRVGATTQQADDATRRELALLSEGRSFDAEPCPKAKIDDKRIQALCTRMYRIARENCDSEAEKRKVKRLTAEQLEAWGVITKVRDKWVASNAYALLTGDPAFAIRLRCGLFKGDDKAVFLDRRDFTGSVPELIDKGLDYILAKINMGCYFKGAFRRDRYELPPDEMRELVINAFAHRSYFQHEAPIFIAIFDTRVEITSPGGLPRGQTVERALGGFSKIRNEVLAKALNYMRFIEEWGSGLQRVNKVFAEYGLKPISLDDAGIAVQMNVYRSLPENVDIGSEKSSDAPVKSTKTRKRRENPPVSPPINSENPSVNPSVNPPLKSDALPENLRFVLDQIAQNPQITYDGLASAMNKHRDTVREYLKRLREEYHFIERVGAPKNGYWRILSPKDND